MGERRHVRGPGVAHDQRRQDILDAVFAIVDEAGTDQLSIRQVADRAGVSVGRVQHYFPSKDELLAAAFEAINQRGTERIHQRLGTERPADPAEAIRLLLEELVPARAEDIRIVRIADAFESYALRRTALGESLRTGYEDLITLLTGLLSDHTRDRAGVERAVIADRARELLGLALGLAGLVVNGSLPADDARRIIGARTAQVLDGR